MEAYIKLFDRDLNRLKAEIALFEQEKDLWITQGQIANSAGNLCLHLLGNLNHFIGATIGKSGYVRNREAEFNEKNVPKEKLATLIDETGKVVSESLQGFNKELLQETYPIQVFGEDMTYEYFLIHLHSHLNYHLGQINYLRRLL